MSQPADHVWFFNKTRFNTRPNSFVLMYAVMCVLLLEVGLAFSFGSTFVGILEEYNEDRSQTSIVQALFIGFGLGLGMVCSAMIDKFGLLRMSMVSCTLCPLGFMLSYFATSLQYLYVSIGIIAAIGFSLGNVCSFTTISRAFTGKQLALCLSLGYAAPTIAVFFYPYLVDWSIDTYGLNGTWLLLGGLLLNTWALPIVIACHRQTFRTPKSPAITKDDVSCDNASDSVNHPVIHYNAGVEKTDSDEDEKRNVQLQRVTIKYYNDHTKAENGEDHGEKVIAEAMKNNDKGAGGTGSNSDQNNSCIKFESLRRSISILANKPFFFVLIGNGIIAGALHGYMGLVLDIAAWKDFSAGETLFVFIPYTVCNTSARLVTGLLKQKKGINSYIFPVAVMVACLIGQFISTYTTSYVPFVLGVSLLGMSNGGTVVSVLVLSAKLVQPYQQTMAFGMILTVTGISTALAGPCFGAIKDVTGSYELLSYVMIVLYITAIACLLASFCLRKRSNAVLPNHPSLVKKSETDDNLDDKKMDNKTDGIVATTQLMNEKEIKQSVRL